MLVWGVLEEVEVAEEVAVVVCTCIDGDTLTPGPFWDCEVLAVVVSVAGVEVEADVTADGIVELAMTVDG